MWKISGKKLFKILCPTEATRQYLIKEKIFEKNKIFVLKDPIVNISKINTLKREQAKLLNKSEKTLLAIGRLSKQKNFLFLINCFSLIIKKYPEYKLLIIGDGEMEKEIKNFINTKKLENKVAMLPFQLNIFKYINNSDCFILSSLWEDPGFVLIEAASVGIPIISSDCPNGPKEFLENGECGYLFKSNNVTSMLNAFDSYINSSQNEKKIKILKAKKKSNFYSMFRHYKELNKILI